MSAVPSTAAKQGITLLRLGVGVQDVQLPEGATLADLLRETGVEARGLEIMIDGRPLAEFVPLRPGAIVSIAPRPREADPGPWVRTFGMFRDDPGFEEMMNRVWAEREAEKDAT